MKPRFFFLTTDVAAAAVVADDEEAEPWLTVFSKECDEE